VPVTLEELSARQRAFSEARAWGPWHTPEEAATAAQDPTLRPKIDDELADVLLYLVRLADVLGVDLIEAANAKIDRNETRFPPNVGRTALEK
jgi:hypothetical protein